MMKYLFTLMLTAVCVVLAGCSGTLTGSVVDEHGCSKQEKWCDSLASCIDPWIQYCPKEGESVRLITAHECELGLGGHAVDYGNGLRCADGERVRGEIAGLLSLHVCCVPSP